MIAAFHHIAVIVSSERSLEFYRKLGFRESFRKKRKNDLVVLMDGFGMQLEMFVDPSHPKAGDSEPVGLRHFALCVDDRLEDEIGRLKAAFADNLEIGPLMYDWSGIRFCFIKDFDGMQIELRE